MLQPIKLVKQRFEYLVGLFYVTGMLVWFAIGYMTCVQIMYSSSQMLENWLRK